MIDVTHWLVAIVRFVVMEELRWVVEELAIAVNCTREGFGEPIQRYTVENIIQRWSLICPLDELLTNPRSSH